MRTPNRCAAITFQNKIERKKKKKRKNDKESNNRTALHRIAQSNSKN